MRQAPRDVLFLHVEVALSQLPEQHGVPLLAQEVPLLRQVPVGWQLQVSVVWQVGVVLPTQKVEQHAVPPTVQVVPLPRQLVAWQLPLTQKVEQQVLLVVLQAAPSTEQHAPLVVLQLPEQHAELVPVVHVVVVPSFRQAPPSGPPSFPPPS